METPNLDNAKKKVAEELVLKFRRDTSALGMKATGKLDSSYGYNIVGNELQIFAERYAEALNDGTTPVTSRKNNVGKFQRFKEWARAKNIRPLVRNAYGNSTFAKYKDNESVYDAMVWRILKSVSKKGIRKRPIGGSVGFIDKIINEQKENIKLVFTESFKKDMVMQIKQIK